MKLKTKFQDEDFELGEVVDATISATPLDTHIKVKAKGKQGREHFFNFSRISELFELFEDYEGPEEYYAIDLQGDAIKWARHSWDEKTTNKIKEIGNYFETQEEAEKAAEKLKAWKRLDDKGFRFKCWEYDDKYAMEFPCILIRAAKIKGCEKDLDLLFGGEE